MRNGLLEMDLSEFSFVFGPAGRHLRCTLGMIFTDEETGLKLGLAMKGCLVTRGKKTGKLQFNTPMTTWGSAKIRTTTLTPAMHKSLVEMVERTKYAEYIGETMPQWAKTELSEMDKKINAELPESLQFTKPAEMSEDELLEGI